MQISQFNPKLISNDLYIYFLQYIQVPESGTKKQPYRFYFNIRPEFSQDSALCEDAKGYSPPMPTPVIIRATIKASSDQAKVLINAPAKVMMEHRIKPERLQLPTWLQMTHGTNSSLKMMTCDSKSIHSVHTCLTVCFPSLWNSCQPACQWCRKVVPWQSCPRLLHRTWLPSRSPSGHLSDETGQHSVQRSS